MSTIIQYIHIQGDSEQDVDFVSRREGGRFFILLVGRCGAKSVHRTKVELSVQSIAGNATFCRISNF